MVGLLHIAMEIGTKFHVFIQQIFIESLLCARPRHVTVNKMTWSPPSHQEQRWALPAEWKQDSNRDNT